MNDNEFVSDQLFVTITNVSVTHVVLDFTLQLYGIS